MASASTMVVPPPFPSRGTGVVVVALAEPAVVAWAGDDDAPAAELLVVDPVPLLVVTLSFSRVRSVQCHTTR